MRLILDLLRIGGTIQALALARLARRDMATAERLARRALDRLEASGLLPLTFTASGAPICVRARWG